MAVDSPPVVSVVLDGTLAYPDSGDFFSPDRSFPEYRFSHVSRKPNAVYAAVRQCLANGGLDQENFGTTAWNPLGCYIKPGQKVFLLCNFVQHKLGNNPAAFHAKCTHGSVIRALTDYIMIALDGRGSVRFGNAPLQSCDWEKVIEDTGARRVCAFYGEFGGGQTPVMLEDLRQHIIHRNSVGTVETRFHGSDTEMCVPVDLGAESLLEELYLKGAGPKFRVLDYDHQRIHRCHGKGRHVYLVSKHILNCDVLVSVPKLKTHEKVGITCGIKGCVGAVGHKDCLAHHRMGTPRQGGDEYPDRLAFLEPLSLLHDAVYASAPGHRQTVLHLLNQYSRMVVRRFTRALSGSWPGNDTCWRMALDLARIAEYATTDGRVHSTRQRQHMILTDGIVGGEGNGPLSPQPVPLGYLCFSDDIAVGDFVNCLAMGFDPVKLPLIREAFRAGIHCLTQINPWSSSIRFNGEALAMREFRNHCSRKFAPPREWRGYL